MVKFLMASPSREVFSACICPRIHQVRSSVQWPGQSPAGLVLLPSVTTCTTELWAGEGCEEWGYYSSAQDTALVGWWEEGSSPERGGTNSPPRAGASSPIKVW